MRRVTFFVTFALILSVAATFMVAQGDANQIVPLNAYKDLKWRSVGATRGGAVQVQKGRRGPVGDSSPADSQSSAR